MCSGKLGEPGTWNVHPHVELASVKHSEFWSGATWVPGDYGEQSIRIEENISSVNTFLNLCGCSKGFDIISQTKKRCIQKASWFVLFRWISQRSLHIVGTVRLQIHQAQADSRVLSHVLSGWIWLGKVCSFRCHVSWAEKIVRTKWRSISWAMAVWFVHLLTNNPICWFDLIRYSFAGSVGS